MDAKQKILVCGDVNGHFKQFFTRMETINKKSGPFDLMLCVGNFFGSDNSELRVYRNKVKHVSVPTYILGPNSENVINEYENLDDGEICQNLTYLGKRGVYTLAGGLKIAYLSGVEPAKPDNPNEWTFTKDDIVSVKNACIIGKSNMGDYRGVDILLTSQWPQNIHEQNLRTSKMISWLANEIKPRYHFCGINNVFYEPAPYRNAADKNTPMELATRFIALSSVGNPEKNKYIYALNITPVEKMRIMELIQKTTDEIPCPYNAIDFNEDKTLPKGDSAKQFFYDMDTHDDDYRKRKNKGFNNDNKRPRPTFDQEKCWFCLSSGSIEKHLIISVGEFFYLALAKGPINETHILILSITHIQSAALLAEEEWKELEKFKNALLMFFKDREQSVFFFERNYKTGHLQINAIGVDNNVAWKLKHVIEDKSEEHNVQMESISKLTDASQLPQRGPYFVAELPDETCMITLQMKNFPLHFGREILCADNLLNCEEKIDWRQCDLSKEAEDEIIKKFRESFKDYDFTL